MKVAASPQIYKGRCPKVVFKSPVTSHKSLCAPNPHSLTTHPCFQTSGLACGAMSEGLRWQVSPVSPAFPSRGRCPAGADRALAACKRAGRSVSSRRFMKAPERRSASIYVKGRCPKVIEITASRFGGSDIDHLNANDNDLRASLEMAIRESDVSKPLVTSHS